MTSIAEPLVTVLTPVYNGEPYLAECIESVLRQTYAHWEYIINDNCSTDRTLEIAQRYARQDSRIRVHRNSEFVRAVPNHNIAVSRMSPDSRYGKVLNADDWLFPECLSRMVAVAEAHPTVGVVGAYRLEDRWVKCDGLPYPSECVTGREIGRFSLLDGWTDLFGSMSTVLFRADLMRASHPFYNEAHLYADTEACYKVLQVSDFGFVHQVLTFSRVHPDQLSSFAASYDTLPLARIAVMKDFGRAFLEPDEYACQLGRTVDRYYAVLGGHLLKGRGTAFWAYHRKALGELGIPFRWSRVIREAGAVAGRGFARPFEAVGRRARAVLARRPGMA